MNGGKSLDVHSNMAFDTRYLLAAIIAFSSSAVSVFLTLWVNDEKTGFSCRPLLIRTPTNFLSTPGRYHHRLRVISLHLLKYEMASAPFRIFFRQHPPLTTTFEQIFIAQNTSYKSTVRGFVLFLTDSSIGNIRLNASVLMSLGYSWDINCSPLLLFSESRPFLKDCEQVLRQKDLAGDNTIQRKPYQ
jgi:hypothetical protein